MASKLNVRIYKGYYLHPDEKKVSDYVNGANVKVTIYDSIVDARAAGYKLVKSGRRKYIKIGVVEDISGAKYGKTRSGVVMWYIGQVSKKYDDMVYLNIEHSDWIPYNLNKDGTLGTKRRPYDY